MSERFITIDQRERRRVGWLVAIVGVFVIALLVVSAVNAASPNVPALSLFGLAFVAAAVWGLRRAFETQTFIEVHPTARTCVVTERGKRGDVRALESLAPLTVSLRPIAGRRSPYSAAPAYGSFSGTGRRSSPTPTYVIHPAGRRDLALFEFRTPDQARHKLEALAAAWNVTSQAYGGEVRSAETLDTMLHQRLAADSGVSRPMALEPQCGLNVEPLSPGYTFSFTRPSQTRFIPAVAS